MTKQSLIGLVDRLVRRAVCAVAGHDYYVMRRLPSFARKVGCRRCKAAWAMLDSTPPAMLPWDAEFEELYAPGGLLMPPNAASCGHSEGETHES